MRQECCVATQTAGTLLRHTRSHVPPRMCGLQHKEPLSKEGMTASLLSTKPARDRNASITKPPELLLRWAS